MRNLIINTLALGLVGTLSNPANAATENFSAIIYADHIDNFNVSSGPDGFNVLAVSGDLSASRSSNQLSRGSIEFDVSGASGTVDSATLFLTAASTTDEPSNHSIAFFGYEGNGIADFADATSGNQIGTLSGTGDEWAAYSGTGLSLNVTSFIAQLVADSSNYAGFGIRRSDETSPGGIFFIQPGNNIYESALRPRLEVSFTPDPVPVPAAAWLFGSCLVGLIGVARRRRK